MGGAGNNFKHWVLAKAVCGFDGERFDFGVVVVCRAFKGLGSETSQISFMAWTKTGPGDETVVDGFTFTFSKET